jgi:hypothetical protein
MKFVGVCEVIGVYVRKKLECIVQESNLMINIFMCSSIRKYIRVTFVGSAKCFRIVK